MYNRPSGLIYNMEGRAVKILNGKPGRPRKGKVVTNLRNRWGRVVACVVRLRNGEEHAYPSRWVKVVTA